MKNIAVKLLMIASVITLSACSTNEDSNFPTLVGTDSQESIKASGTNVVTNNSYVGISKGKNTGTFVGQKVIAFRTELDQIQKANRAHGEELQKIRNSVASNATQYNSLISAIETKLQVGTTPGNPIMYNSLQQAQTNLQNMSTNANALDNLSAKVANNATSTLYLLDSIRSAFTISGAVDEDHTQLRSLQNEAEQVSVLINSLNNDISGDVERQQQYLISAREQVNRLNNAIKVGSFQGAPAPRIAPARPLFGAGAATGQAMDKPSNVAKPAAAMRGKPVFSVKFSNDNIDYMSGLKASVDAALERKPSSTFEVVAVSNSNNQAKAQSYANKVFQEVVGFGINPNNVNLGAKNDPKATTPEIQVFAK